MEVDLLIPRKRGGTSALHNLQLLHDHCRYLKTVEETNRHDRCA
jgi:5-methylcytosine-specific restriction endonuclease McrA